VSTKGFLSDCSLEEIFLLIEKGHKTGVLRLHVSSAYPESLPLTYYIWVYQGRIVAVANRLDQQGLVSLIAQDQGIKNRLVAKLAQSCPINQPLGSCLKKRLILEAEQVKHLFKVQVLQQVCALFQIKQGQFEFYQNVAIPTREMTGLSVSLTAVNQYCLWEAPSDSEELPLVTGR
jgi:hypothetical protein